MGIYLMLVRSLPLNEEIEETGVVQETLSKVLAEAEPSFQQANAVKTEP